MPANRRTWWAAAGVVAAIAAAVIGWWRLSGDRTKPTGKVHLPRVTVETRPADLPPIELIAPRGDVIGFPALDWRPVVGALGYRVVVMTDTGTPIVTRDVPAPPLPWPSSVPTPPGGYQWRVDARSGKGIIAASPPVSFRILQ